MNITENFLHDGGPLTDRVSKFFQFKTIQRSYNFLVYFDESGSFDFDNTGISDLMAYHATAIDIPDYSFKKEYVSFGPFSKAFPILEHNGFEFNIKFEEDELGTVKELINNLTRKNIDENGYYNSYKASTLSRIVASVYTQDAWNVYKVYFKNCFFLKASQAQYSFDSNNKIEYDITFNCDHYEIIPHKSIATNLYKEKENDIVNGEITSYKSKRQNHNRNDGE